MIKTCSSSESNDFMSSQTQWLVSFAESLSLILTADQFFTWLYYVTTTFLFHSEIIM